MASANDKRGAVVSANAKEKLTSYMGFRHKSRHMYLIKHDWDMMLPLISDLTDVWALVREEIYAFADSL